MNEQNKDVKHQNDAQLAPLPSWSRPKLVRLSADATHGGTLAGFMETQTSHTGGSAMMTGSI